MSAPNKKRVLRGCIDLGSSYFRLLVVHLDPVGSVRVIGDEKEYVGWGASIADGGALSRRDMARAAAALEILLGKARDIECECPLLLGTNTLRSAANAAEALAALEETAGRPITVIDQRIEAELGFLGASTIVPGGDPALLVDIGGTSTEISWGRNGAMEDHVGLPLGTHTAAMMGRRNPRDAAVFPRFAGARRIGESIGEQYALPDDAQRLTIIATGGTAVSLAIVLRYMRERTGEFADGTRITAGMLGLAVRRVQGIFSAGRERRIPLDSQRLLLLLPGLWLMASLFRVMRVEEFLVTARDLRWGALVSDEYHALTDHGGRCR